MGDWHQEQQADLVRLDRHYPQYVSCLMALKKSSTSTGYETNLAEACSS
ncbi:hypothetical protein [Argonema galeatum]|nr:hypothetical protein [Argonema galeatum]MCL1468602.1 hypothetical protein [Argonema galeatum A003/A1]